MAQSLQTLRFAEPKRIFHKTIHLSSGTEITARTCSEWTEDTLDDLHGIEQMNSGRQSAIAEETNLI
jgi:hypothetical protein